MSKYVNEISKHLDLHIANYILSVAKENQAPIENVLLAAFDTR